MFATSTGMTVDWRLCWLRHTTERMWFLPMLYQQVKLSIHTTIVNIYCDICLVIFHKLILLLQNNSPIVLLDNVHCYVVQMSLSYCNDSSKKSRTTLSTHLIRIYQTSTCLQDFRNASEASDFLTFHLHFKESGALFLATKINILSEVSNG